MPATDDTGSSLRIAQRELDARGWRASWLLSTVWLVFSCFAIVSVWFGEDLSQLRKVAATVIALAFAATYAVGFRRTIRCSYAGVEPRDLSRTAWLFQGALTALMVLAMLVGGWGMLGLVPYVVAFAIFNLDWAAVAVIAPLGVLYTVLAPLIGGVYEDLWVLTPVTIAVGAGMVLIRIVEGRERDRALLQTEMVVSDERHRVARDVHDVLGHSLTAVVLKAELAQRLLGQLEPITDADRAVVARCDEELSELQAISRRALSEIRSTVGGLRNPTLADEVSVARTVLADGGVALTVLGDPADVPGQYRSTLAWVVRESVTNVVRHAQAKHCTVEFGPEASSLVRITDDGVGLGDNGDDGNGLRGLRERTTAAGARLVVDEVEDGGTRVEVRV
ncbi:MAG: sensor histidine kinase [Actinomycetota bacterium]